MDHSRRVFAAIMFNPTHGAVEIIPCEDVGNAPVVGIECGQITRQPRLVDKPPLRLMGIGDVLVARPVSHSKTHKTVCIIAQACRRAQNEPEGRACPDTAIFFRSARINAPLVAGVALTVVGVILLVAA
jgi:hypothetical protein